MKHYHLMNGSAGCIPDNNELHTSRKSAIDSACFMFDDLPAKEIREMKRNLKAHDIHYFSDYVTAGADYVQVYECHEADCETEE